MFGPLRGFRVGARGSGSRTWRTIRGRINQVLAETSFLYGGNAAFVEDLYARWADDPESVDALLARLLRHPARQARGGPPRPRPTRPGRPSIPEPAPDWLTSAIDGMWPAVEAKLGKADRRQGRPGRHRRRRSAPRRWIPSARYHDDPRLPDARPPGGQPRPPGHRRDARRPPSSTRPPTASPRPTSTGRSSSTSCWAWRPPRSARSWRSCAAPTAATSACSTCTSPTRTRRPGCRSASRAATRRSPSPTRARSPS